MSMGSPLAPGSGGSATSGTDAKILKPPGPARPAAVPLPNYPPAAPAEGVSPASEHPTPTPQRCTSPFAAPEQQRRAALPEQALPLQRKEGFGSIIAAPRATLDSAGGAPPSPLLIKTSVQQQGQARILTQTPTRAAAAHAGQTPGSPSVGAARQAPSNSAGSIARPSGIPQPAAAGAMPPASPSVSGYSRRASVTSQSSVTGGVSSAASLAASKAAAAATAATSTPGTPRAAKPVTAGYSSAGCFSEKSQGTATSSTASTGRPGALFATVAPAGASSAGPAHSTGSGKQEAAAAGQQCILSQAAAKVAKETGAMRARVAPASPAPSSSAAAAAAGSVRARQLEYAERLKQMRPGLRPSANPSNSASTCATPKAQAASRLGSKAPSQGTSVAASGACTPRERAGSTCLMGLDGGGPAASGSSAAGTSQPCTPRSAAATARGPLGSAGASSGLPAPAPAQQVVLVKGETTPDSKAVRTPLGAQPAADGKSPAPPKAGASTAQAFEWLQASGLTTQGSADAFIVVSASRPAPAEGRHAGSVAGDAPASGAKQSHSAGTGAAAVCQTPHKQCSDSGSVVLHNAGSSGSQEEDNMVGLGLGLTPGGVSGRLLLAKQRSTPVQGRLGSSGSGGKERLKSELVAAQKELSVKAESVTVLQHNIATLMKQMMIKKTVGPLFWEEQGLGLRMDLEVRAVAHVENARIYCPL